MIQITQDDYILEKRFFLESYLIHQDGTKKMLPIALNDVVVGHSAIGKMVRLHLHIDKQFIQTYAADGIIISSPTGSTGYAMSCGGPVLPSDSKDFLVIPVCVHTGLTSPLIIPNNAEVKITLPEREKNVHISLDGTYTFQMAPTDQLIIKNCLKQIRFIRFKDQGFFKILTKKFENYEKGDHVIVDTIRGEQIGIVLGTTDKCSHPSSRIYDLFFVIDKYNADTKIQATLFISFSLDKL